MIKTVAELNAVKEKNKAAVASHASEILICGGTGCVSGKSRSIFEIFNKLIAENKLENKVLEAESTPGP